MTLPIRRKQATTSIPGENKFPEVTIENSDLFRWDTAGYATGEYAAMTGNSVTLSPGKYLLRGVANFTLSTVADGSSFGARWTGSNGENTSTIPDSISTLPGVTVLSGDPDTLMLGGKEGAGGLGGSLVVSDLYLDVSEESTIFLTCIISFTTAGNSGCLTCITAVRLGD